MAHQSRDRGGDHYRPHYKRNDGPPPPPPGMFQFRGAAGRDRNGANGRSDFTFRAPKPKIHERPLLQTAFVNHEEKVLSTGVNGERFRNLDELTDSDEAEMENSDEDDNEKPSAKRARVEVAQPEQPKWSNPDVYTSLPAPSESTGKRIDFVKLIRKARNSGTKQNGLDDNEENFISFGDIEPPDAPPPDAPSGPKIKDTDRALGKRKRGEDTGSKVISRRGQYFYEDGMVLDEWRVKANVHPAPWLLKYAGDNAGIALHKEILDFYEWVRPREYESDVRRGVIDRISAALNRIEPGELKAFGSYAAGLFLPTGDMDLVYLPRGFNQRKGHQNGISPNQLRKFAEYLRRSGIVQPDSLTAIPKAKVPIIKFVERVSGLKVDLSFNNDTGIVANQTFLRWREQYPAMPVLVAIVKQFLMIRGLNDVSVGGLGGFSSICLVTSLLQHLPTSGNAPNLGEMLLEFFNLYGNLLDRHNIGIRMEPPGYVDKRTQTRHMNNDRDGRLLIIDPNRADNNISGGTKEIDTISACFSQAYDTLLNRLFDYDGYDAASGPFSFLEKLIGGDFRAYQDQRNILYELHYGRAGPAPSVIPPPPPPITHDPPAPPPPPANRAANDQSMISGGHSNSNKFKGKLTFNHRRAIRVKRLRPDIAPLIGEKLTAQEAVTYGKYKDSKEMLRDLAKRETEMRKGNQTH